MGGFFASTATVGCRKSEGLNAGDDGNPAPTAIIIF